MLGFWAGLALPRWLTRCPGLWSGPVAALAVGMAFQLTVGWLHLADPAAMSSPIPLAEGLILAWAAAAESVLGTNVERLGVAPRVD